MTLHTLHAGTAREARLRGAEGRPNRVRCCIRSDPPSLQEGGFSLVEIIAAMAITSIVILGYSSMTVAVAESGARAEEMAIGVGAAEDKLEELMVGPVAGLANDKDVLTMPTGEILDRTWVVTTNVPMAGLTTLEVTVAVRGAIGKKIRLHSIRRQ